MTEKEPDIEQTLKTQLENGFYLFREAQSLDELTLLLGLRYKVFSESQRLENAWSENDYKIDLDSWDLYSRHFGLFVGSPAKLIPVGYVRMVTDAEGPMKDQILSLKLKFPGLFEKIETPPPEPFPLLTYCPQADIVKSLYKEIKGRGERLVEASRLALAQSLTTLKSFRIAKRLVESIFAAAIFSNIENAMLSCSVHSKTFYQRFGFYPIPKIADFPMYGIPSCCLWARTKEVPLTKQRKNPAKGRIPSRIWLYLLLSSFFRKFFPAQIEPRPENVLALRPAHLYERG